MGCRASKLENEDTVRRCKERSRFMKNAVYARHHLAAAHSDYCRSLRLTGSALSSFAAAHSLSISHNTPAVFLRRSTPPTNPDPPCVPPPPTNPDAPCVPPPPPASHRVRKPQKLPRILSESSPSSSPRSERSTFTSSNFYPTAYQNSTISRSPSQASSLWNWENFYPPSPPDSEFFERKARENAQTQRSEREEVQCSEWADHDRFSAATSSDDEEEEVDARSAPSESSAPSGYVKQHQWPEQGGLRKENAEDVTSSLDRNMVVRHKDLKEMVDAIQEYFDKAASAGDKVSPVLEIDRAQLDRSFRKLKKTVYHSSSVLNNLRSSWTSKPPLAVKYKLDASTLDEGSGPNSLSSTLDRLLAWEKKLFQEVKAREEVKMEHERKLSALKSQEYKVEQNSKLDKTKASINRLQSMIIVTSQAVSTTSSAILCLRDTHLLPQLVQLSQGLMCMWKSMHVFHEIQNNIVQQVRGLVNQTDNQSDSTSELHHQVTRDLESAVSLWHSSFCRLIKFQRDFICALHGWFKLTLLPLLNENANSDPHPERSDAYVFCDEWKLSLDRVPDTVASEAIKSFVNVVHVISVKQSEEIKMRKRTETASKELEKKASAIRKIERKYYQSYSTVGINVPGAGPDLGHGLDAGDPLSEQKSELAAYQRRVEEEKLRHTKAVEVTRAMTLNNLQTGLPNVFQALTSFSALFTEALEGVCSRSPTLSSK